MRCLLCIFEPLVTYSFLGSWNGRRCSTGMSYARPKRSHHHWMLWMLASERLSRFTFLSSCLPSRPWSVTRYERTAVERGQNSCTSDNPLLSFGERSMPSLMTAGDAPTSVAGLRVLRSCPAYVVVLSTFGIQLLAWSGPWPSVSPLHLHWLRSNI